MPAELIPLMAAALIAIPLVAARRVIVDTLAPPARTGGPSYENDAVVRRLAREARVDEATARARFHEMLRFLDDCADSRAPVPPSRSVEEAWHAFILHTRDYEASCRRRFGRLVHHRPYERPDPRAYARAYEAVRWPARDRTVWPLPHSGPDVAHDMSGCGGEVSGWCGGAVGGGDAGGDDNGGCGGR